MKYKRVKGSILNWTPLLEVKNFPILFHLCENWHCRAASDTWVVLHCGDGVGDLVLFSLGTYLHLWWMSLISNLIVLFCFGSCVQCFQPFPDGLFYEASLFSFVIFCALDSPENEVLRNSWSPCSFISQLISCKIQSDIL